MMKTLSLLTERDVVVQIIHKLKTWPKYFQDSWDGIKTFEVRTHSDGDFIVGQKIMLQEWIPDSQLYTGREILATISYLLMWESLAIFSIQILSKKK